MVEKVPLDEKNKVFFIDAFDLYQKGRTQNIFLSKHANAIIALYENFSDVEAQSKIVEIDEVKENEYNLNISRYVEKPFIFEEIDLKATIDELEKAYEQFLKSEEQMKSILREEGIL